MVNTINAGTLVHQVTIQRLPVGADAVDASGAPEETGWVTLCVAAMGRLTSARTVQGDETFTAVQLSGSIITRWVMRYLASMDPDLVDVQKERRLLYQTRVYDIIAVEPMDRKSGLVLRTLASSRVPS